MEEDLKQKETEKDSETTTISPKIISLAIAHDGNESTNNYINMINEKFNQYFGKVFIISEDEENIDSLNSYDNLDLIPFLKPTNNQSDWLMILEIGELPSLQLMDNLKDIVGKAPEQTNVLFFPIVLCDPLSGEILEILEPVSRVFRQIPKMKPNNDMEEIILEDFPIIKFLIEPAINHSEIKEEK